VGNVLEAVLGAESVQVALWVGIGGALLAVANLAFARVLDPVSFGWLSLFQALLSVGVSLTPLGMDSLIVRRQLPSDTRALTLSARWVLPGGMLAGLIGLIFYGFSAAVAALLALGCVAGGIVQVIAACDRAELRFNRAQLAAQFPFVVFAIGALLMVFGSVPHWQPGAAVMTAGYGVAAGLGIAMLVRVSRSAPAQWNGILGLIPHWSQASSFLGIAASVLLLLQLERLLIPHLLTLSDLAAFTVVATLVGSPYRLLQAGIVYSLMPRLRSTPNARARRAIIRREVALAATLALGGGAVLVVMAGPVIRLLYGGKYPVDFLLILSIALVGCTKVACGVVEGVAGALGTATTLSRYNLAGWLVTCGAVVVAVLLARFGLVGIVGATGIGWIVRTIAGWELLKRQGSSHG
jgi:O-antigen/teichoic acid export membrane protein